MSDLEDEDLSCPLCIQRLDATDRAINYCVCGYQMCLWCWNTIMETAAKDNIAGRCPNCRTVYDKQKIEMHAITPELLEEERRKKKEEKKKGHKAVAKNKQDLAHIRVVQRNLVYAVGLPMHICREETLAEKQYFGQYGKTKKISVNRSGIVGQAKGVASGSAYVTYARNEDAMRCIEAIDGTMWDGKPIRACFGTTKYCNAFLKGVVCNNPDCLYLHDIANEDDSFNKDDMANGTLSKHIMQLVHPLAGERGKAAVLGKAPAASLPQPFPAANGAATHHDGPSMTQLGKAQPGPSANAWASHQVHVPPPAAEPTPPAAPGVQKAAPPGPLLAEQEWPALAASLDEGEARDGDTLARTLSTTLSLSRTSSLTGDLTVADAVKAAIAAATATKPTAKQQAPAKPAAQTITLTKPTKLKGAAAVMTATKGKAAATAAAAPPQVAVWESSTSAAGVATSPPPAGLTMAAVAAGVHRDSRVAAAVEAALNPPSPSPMHQVAAASPSTVPVATKAGKAAAKVAAAVAAAPQQTATSNGVHPTGTPDPSAAAAPAASSSTMDKPGKQHAGKGANTAQAATTAASTSQPPATTSAAATCAPARSSSDSGARAEASASEVQPVPSQTAAPDASASPSTPSTATQPDTSTSTETGAASSVPLISPLISSNDPPVVLPQLPQASSSTSLAAWLPGDGSKPVDEALAAARAGVPGPSLDPALDAPVQLLVLPRPAVPPGFDVPAAGTSQLKQLLVGPVSTRGPPPGFSTPYQQHLTTAAPPSAAPPAELPVPPIPMPATAPGPPAVPVAPAAAAAAAVPGLAAPANNYFDRWFSPRMATGVSTKRQGSRFSFAQDSSTPAAEVEPTPAADVMRHFGLGTITEAPSHSGSSDPNSLMRFFGQPNRHPPAAAPAPVPNGTIPVGGPWNLLAPAQQLNPTHSEAHRNGAHPPPGNSNNPGLALLQQLQRAARADAYPPHLAGSPPLQPLAGMNLQHNPYAPLPQASQPPAPPAFLDPAIINAKAITTPEQQMGAAPGQNWPPGFGNAAAAAQNAAPGTAGPSIHALFQQQQQQQQQQQRQQQAEATALFNLLSRPPQQQQQAQQAFAMQQQLRPQQRAPPPGYGLFPQQRA